MSHIYLHFVVAHATLPAFVDYTHAARRGGCAAARNFAPRHFPPHLYECARVYFIAAAETIISASRARGEEGPHFEFRPKARRAIFFPRRGARVCRWPRVPVRKRKSVCQKSRRPRVLPVYTCIYSHRVRVSQMPDVKMPARLCSAQRGGVILLRRSSEARASEFIPQHACRRRRERITYTCLTLGHLTHSARVLLYVTLLGGGKCAPEGMIKLRAGWASAVVYINADWSVDKRRDDSWKIFPIPKSSASVKGQSSARSAAVEPIRLHG